MDKTILLLRFAKRRALKRIPAWMKKGRYYKTHYLGRRSSKEKKEIDAFFMDDSTLKTFQKNALRLFDLPHHPRRLRQAALKWKAWREKVLAHSSKKIINLSLIHI